MPGVANVKQGEKYTIRQKILRFLGNVFHVYDESGAVVGYCKQKAFRFREDIRFYTDETQQTELFSMRARSILDFSTTYDVAMPDGTIIGSLRRKGWSSVLRDEWMVFDAPGGDGAEPVQIASLKEDSMTAALVRRFIEVAAIFMPQKFTLATMEGSEVAVFRTHVNPFVYRLGVTVNEDLVQRDSRFDDILILATGCLIAAIEGRQSGGGSGSGLLSGN